MSEQFNSKGELKKDSIVPSNLSKKTLSKEDIKKMYSKKKDGTMRKNTFTIPTKPKENFDSMQEQFNMDKIEGFIQKLGVAQDIDLLKSGENTFFDSLRLQLNVALQSENERKVEIVIGEFSDEIDVDTIPYLLRKINEIDTNYKENLKSLQLKINELNENLINELNLNDLPGDKQLQFKSELLKLQNEKLKSFLARRDHSIINVGYHKENPQIILGGTLSEELEMKLTDDFTISIAKLRADID